MKKENGKSERLNAQKCVCDSATVLVRVRVGARTGKRERMRQNGMTRERVLEKMRQRCKRDQEHSKDWQQSNGSRKDNKSLLAEMRCDVDTVIDDDTDDDADPDIDGMEAKLPADLCRGINQQPSLNDNSNATLL